MSITDSASPQASAVHVVVSGRVQGVGYRAFAARAARGLGLVGYVRNTPHGAVETQARGAPESVESYLAALRSGPPAASVEDLAVSVLHSETVVQKRFDVL